LRCRPQVELQRVVVAEAAVLDEIRGVDVRVRKKRLSRQRADGRTRAPDVEVRERRDLSRLNQTSYRRVRERATAEIRDLRQRLAASDGRIERWIEHSAVLERQKAVASRTKEIVLKRAAWVHLIQIDPADYEAQVAQSEAAVAAAQAALDNLANQVELQYATIAQAQAARLSAEALEVEARQEQERQQSLSQTESGTRQRFEQAVANYAKAQADVRASRAVIAAQQHQLEVLQGTRKQRAADLEATKASLASAKLKLGYTKISAPFDGVVGERQVQPGDYVNIGTNLINVVPLPKVYVIANYKETQLTHVAPGQPVEITVDSFPREKLRGKVERIAPATGAQVALLPPDNATGNFTKVVQRIPVRIQLDDNQPLLARLVPGMSVVTSIDTKAANGGK